MKFRVLTEMAKSRAEVMDTCEECGEEFIEHFIKVFDEGIDSKDFKHHCGEMYSWFLKANKLKFKHNNKLISNEKLIDYFFTLGSDYDTIFNEMYYNRPQYIKYYIELQDKLLETRNRRVNISDIIESILR